jgi:hypothetical protein
MHDANWKTLQFSIMATNPTARSSKTPGADELPNSYALLRC